MSASPVHTENLDPDERYISLPNLTSRKNLFHGRGASRAYQVFGTQPLQSDPSN